MADKTTRFNKTGITILPDDKPVVYKITTEGGKNNYTGTAQRGRVQERLAEHLAEGRIPGAKVKVEQQPSIKAALEKEARVIARSQPPTTSRASNASLWGPARSLTGGRVRRRSSIAKWRQSRLIVHSARTINFFCASGHDNAGGSYAVARPKLAFRRSAINY